MIWLCIAAACALSAGLGRLHAHTGPELQRALARRRLVAYVERGGLTLRWHAEGDADVEVRIRG